ncbi:glycosyltransferase family 4 protein [Legionella longbeachae]|uniref:glycosyltransferase family 4 protein n=1 Tax=Legionella longbeachae TaxID=450 RepID=UPI0012493AB2|nr:glycosyltransferase family 4 protein [Legionella longbeachae]QEY52868.1 glycosyltransferase family 4 protein [Legionella longbeachae]
MSKRTVFFLSFFPRKTETFIHNELIGLLEKNVDFKVISLLRASSNWVQSASLKEIVTRHFCSLGYLIWLKGLFVGLKKPRMFFSNVIWIARLNHKNIIYRLRAFSALLVAYGVQKFVVQEKMEYIHAHFASYPTEIAMCLSRITGIPYGATWHAFDIWRDGNILVEKIAYAEQIVTCTQYNLKYLQSIIQPTGINKNKLKCIYHGVDFRDLPKSAKIASNFPLLAVGRLIPKKGFCYLLDALALLKQKGIIVKLNLVGFQRPFLDRITSGEGSELKRLKHKIKEHGLQNQVQLLNYLPHPEVLAVMGKSYALIMPSILDKKNNMDGIPNVVLEAMAMQRPVIASRLSGIPEVVRDFKTGLLVDPGNSEQLARAIETLLQDLELAKELGQEGYKFVMQHFNLQKTVMHCLHCFSCSESLQQEDAYDEVSVV